MLSDAERVLWHSLATTLSFDEMSMTQRVQALHWLSQVAAADERKDKTSDIARVMEEVLLDIIRTARRAEFPTEATRHMVQRQLVPLVEGPLLQHFNPTLRQLVGVIIDRKEQLRADRTIGVQFPNGNSYELEIAEGEAINAAMTAFRAEKDHHKGELGPTWVVAKIDKRLADGRLVRIPYRVELILLLPDADVKSQLHLIEHLLGYFLVVDPSIAEALSQFQKALIQRNDIQSRNHALTELIEAYLLSPYFGLVRDFTHGIRVLRDGPIEALDIFCGITTDLQAPAEGPPAFKSIGMLQPSSPGSSKRALAALAIRTRAIFETLLNQLRVEYSPDQIPLLSAYLREGAADRISVFDSLWDFCLGLMLSELPKDSGVPPDELEILRNWVTEFLARQLQVGLHPSARDSDVAPVSSKDEMSEYIRRHVHAITLRLGVYIAASPRHVSELQSRSANRDVVINWLVMGLVLADRLLVVAYHDHVFRSDEDPSNSRPSMEDLRAGFDRLFGALAVDVDVNTYPDILNPFLYGPYEYDHFLAGVLALLVASLDGNRRETVPFWMSSDVESALDALAKKLENEEEAHVRASREQGKPNRLEVILDRTPQELAAAILAKVKDWGRQAGAS